MIVLQNISYTHPSGDVLFDDINLVVNKYDKIALIGNNGSGKSTLLQLVAGRIKPSFGSVTTHQDLYYMPQIFGQYNQSTIAQVLLIDAKLSALQEIIDGHVSQENMDSLGDDWTIEERCRAAFAHWALGDLSLDQKLETLSGGQKAKVFLAGIHIHRPKVVLLDEPSNHLDSLSREMLYNYIMSTNDTLMVVSHDRFLLNLLDQVAELGKRGITLYGRNYNFYQQQKNLEDEALSQTLQSKEKALRKAREKERETAERQQKLDARGKRKQVKSGVPTIFLNTLRNNAEKSTSKMKDVHAEKVGSMAKELTSLRMELSATAQMRIGFDHSGLHTGKILISAKNINFAYGEKLLWQTGLSFQISSGDRVAIKGPNGSGKTSLIKMMLSELEPQSGAFERSDFKAIYIDQDYSLIDDKLSVYEQAQQFNSGTMQEHEIKIRLNRFLFDKTYWDIPCRVLSGGEKMRLMLCSLTIRNQAPDMIILDEPTNNLDIQNIEILTSAVNEYPGTLIVVSHDSWFLDRLDINNNLDTG